MTNPFKIQAALIFQIFLLIAACDFVKQQDTTNLQFTHFTRQTIPLHLQQAYIFQALIIDINFNYTIDNITQFYPFVLVSYYNILPDYESLKKIIDQDKLSLLSQYKYDIIGFSKKKKSQRITIKLPEAMYYDIGFYDFSNDIIPKDLSYDVYLSVFAHCPNNCSRDTNSDYNTNICQEGICICPKDQIANDCSQKVFPLNQGSLNIQATLPQNFQNQWYTTSFFVTKKYQTIKMNFNILTTDVLISYFFQSYSNIQEPNFFYNTAILTKNTKQFQLPQTIFDDYITQSLKKNFDPFIFIAFYNLENYTSSIDMYINIQLKAVQDKSSSSDEDDSNSFNAQMFAYLFVGVIISAILFIFLCQYAKLKLKPHGQQSGVVIPIIDQQQAFDTNLDSKSIQKLMPKILYSQLVQEYNKLSSLKECIICLTDFKEDNYVRMTICFHLFHQQCIDEWLQHQVECPTCRQKFTKLEIIKLLTNNETLNKNNYIIQTLNPDILQNQDLEMQEKIQFTDIYFNYIRNIRIISQKNILQKQSSEECNNEGNKYQVQIFKESSTNIDLPNAEPTSRLQQFQTIYQLNQNQGSLLQIPHITQSVASSSAGSFSQFQAIENQDQNQ